MFEDHASGAAPDRPSLTACLDYLRRGDVLVVLDLDRLGRRAGELITLIDELDQRGIGFRAFNSPMDHHAGGPDLSADPGRVRRDGAQCHPPARTRGREGRPGARGRKGGRPRIMTPEKAALRPEPHGRPHTLDSAHLPRARDLPSSTLYHYLRADGTLKGPGEQLLALMSPCWDREVERARTGLAAAPP